MIKKLYDWTLEKAQRPTAKRWLGAIAFAESSFFPLPIDLMLIPMIIANRLQAFQLATITLLASVFGGMFGYIIGAFFFDAVGEHIIAIYGYQEQFAAAKEYYLEYGILIVLIAGFSPIPYKVITIMSGVVGMNPLLFFAVSIPARGARFFLVAGLLWKFGEPIREFIEKRLTLVLTGFILLGLAGFAVLKFVG